MTIDDLRNAKIYLSSVENRAKFQDKVFKLGVKWKDGKTKVGYLNDFFFYINNDLQMTVDDNTQWFLRKRIKQIFLEDVLDIEEPKKECKFKPYDKVLMRDNKNNPQWMPTLFASYYDNPTYQYMNINRTLYSECVPYEGNEDLANTTKNPKQ